MNLARLLALVGLTALIAAAPAAAASVPEVSLTTPSVGARVTGSVDIQASASASVTHVAFLIDGRRIAVDRQQPYQATWDASEASPGLYGVRAIAFDRSGRRSLADRREVRVGQEPPPLWTGGLAPWLRRFHAQYAVAPDRIRAEASPSGDGGDATRFEVRHGDRPTAGGARAELAMFDRRVNGFDTGSAPRYYGWQTFIPADYPASPDWQTLVQWHQSRGPAAPSPLKLALVRGSGEFALAARAQPGADEEWLYTAPAARGVWHSFVLGVRWSPRGDEGWVELWHNGRKVLDRAYRPTQYTLADGSAIPNAFKHGLYRSPQIPVTQVVYHRGTRVALTPAAAQPVD